VNGLFVYGSIGAAVKQDFLLKKAGIDDLGRDIAWFGIVNSFLSVGG